MSTAGPSLSPAGKENLPDSKTKVMSSSSAKASEGEAHASSQPGSGSPRTMDAEEMGAKKKRRLDTERPVFKLNRPPVSKGLKFPTEAAHPAPSSAPPVGASGLRLVPPKPGLPKLPREPLPSLKLEKVRVKTKSEVYEPLTERDTTGGMARGLARDDTVSSLYCSTPACADDVEPAKMKRRFRRVDAALGRYAKAPRRWWFRRPRAAGVGRRKG